MIASVIVDILSANVDKVFDYIIPAEMTVKKGHRVSVPFGGRNIEGYVIDIKSQSGIEENKLKSIIKTLEELPLITEENLRLLYFMQKKYHILLAEALRLFIPSQLRGGRVKEKTVTLGYLNTLLNFDDVIGSISGRAVKQIEAVKYLSGGKREDIALLNKKFGRAAVAKLIEKDIILTCEEEIGRKPYQSIKKQEQQSLTLTYRQKAALDIINKNSPDTFLLFGVTGSGKTEVYLDCIENALKNGKTAIMMVPEIALTPQIMRIFRNRFGDSVAMLHSGLSWGERLDEWNRLRRGKAKIAVGARSAVFAPLENVGVIIIDEQHEQSYISESSPRYDTKDIALFRAKYNNCSLIMGSATPLIESFYYAQSGRYKLVEMTERINGEMPQISIADMRREVLAGNNSCFSSVLKDKIETQLKSGNQIILFINRRGYSPMIICSECGYVARCLNCDVSLNYHKDENRLKCHYCGGRYEVLGTCPQCKGNKLKKSGTGTQKVCDEINKIFPQAKVLRMDNDTTQSKEAHLKIIRKFEQRQADILVGTQMIAKGHDFPAVTLVGVLDADLSLYFADYRSIERTFSLITQVAGRAGRADKEGEVIIQTHTPAHYVYRLIYDYDYKGFYQREISLRKAAKYPPFAKILRVLCMSEDEESVKEVTKNIYNAIKEIKDNNSDKFIYFNVMKAPVAKIKNKYRYQILARVTDFDDKITDFIYDIVDVCKNKNVVSYLEVNPSSMY